MYIVTLAHFAEEYNGDWYFTRLVVWFTRIPVRVTIDPAASTRRFARWFAIKSRVD